MPRFPTHARIDILEGALVAPITTYAPPVPDPATGRPEPGVFDGGVYRADGALFPGGENAYLTHRNVASEWIDAAGAERLPGTWLYLGMLQNNHFGHFVSESLSRIWGVDAAEGLDGLLHIRRFPARPLRQHVGRVLDVLAPGARMHHAEQVTRVDRLVVPQAIRFPQGYLAGHAQMGPFLRRRVDAILATGRGPGHRRIYVSRSALPQGAPAARLLLEDVIDASFRAEGYAIVHPERLSFADQLRLYAGAEELVFSEGSAFHVYVMAARPGQRVFNVIRRRVVHPVFERQFASFGGGPVAGSSHVVAMYPRRDAPTVLARAATLLDFEALGRELVGTGFLDGAGWRVPGRLRIAAAKAKAARTYRIERPV